MYGLILIVTEFKSLASIKSSEFSFIGVGGVGVGVQFPNVKLKDRSSAGHACLF